MQLRSDWRLSTDAHGGHLNPARDRVGQFFGALAAAVSPPDSALAADVLPPKLFEIFERMPAADRRHAFAVFSALKNHGESDLTLLSAALMHDVGKADAGITVVHRVARVLLRSTMPPLWCYLSGWPTGWRRPFWVVANHAERGAVWVETRGGEADVVGLIRYHEQPAPAEWRDTAQGRRHAALSATDACH